MLGQILHVDIKKLYGAIPIQMVLILQLGMTYNGKSCCSCTTAFLQVIPFLNENNRMVFFLVHSSKTL